MRVSGGEGRFDVDITHLGPEILLGVYTPNPARIVPDEQDVLFVRAKSSRPFRSLGAN
jgi:hypothetical protein